MSIWYKIGAVGTLIVVLVGWHYLDRKNAVSAAVEAQRSIYTALVQKEVIQAQEVSNSLLNSTLQDLSKKNEEIKAINAKLSNVLSELHKRPSRQDSATTPTSRKTCTGAELYREDGEFLIREAARADKLIKERDYYYEQYERARQALATHQKSDGGQ